MDYDSIKQYLTFLNRPEYYINSDRAYLAAHNIQWLLDYLEENNQLDTVTLEEERLINDLMGQVLNYRIITKASIEANKASITDGDAREFWKLLESSPGSQQIATELQELHEKFWSLIEDRYLRDKQLSKVEVDVPAALVDVQNDFSVDGITDPALPVSKVDDIIDTLEEAVFRSMNPESIYYTRDMHTPSHIFNEEHGFHGALWDSRWVKADQGEDLSGQDSMTLSGMTFKRTRFSKDQIQQPLFIGSNSLETKSANDTQFCKNCGNLCWGPHCQRDHIGGSYIRRLPLHPKATHIFKGTTPVNHPYGGGIILASILKDKGHKLCALYGWATQYCVATTGKELLAEGVDVIAVRSGMRGIVGPSYNPDVDDATVAACFETDNKAANFNVVADYEQCMETATATLSLRNSSKLKAPVL